METMKNDDADDGYSEQEDEEPCAEFMHQNSVEFDEKLLYGNALNADGEPRNVFSLFSRFADASDCNLRQLAALEIPNLLHKIVTATETYSLEEDLIEKVFGYISAFSEDSNINVRRNLFYVLPKIANFCVEYGSSVSLPLKRVIESTILPSILKEIADEDKNYNVPVRRKGYSMLKYLLNENFIDQQTIQEKICAISESLLTQSNNLRSVISAGNLIANMSPVVGEATTEKLLLPKITALCSHVHPKVREACVHFLIDMACHVNSLVTENIIIPLFIKLSEDDAACVRRACAGTTVILSCLCLMESRKTVLYQVFVGLLRDEDTSVSTVAYKQLGAFITTFAQPATTALASSRDEDFLLIHETGSTFRLLSRRCLYQLCEPEQTMKTHCDMLTMPGINMVYALESSEHNETNENENTAKEEDFYNNNNNNNNSNSSSNDNRDNNKLYFGEYMMVNDENSNFMKDDEIRICEFNKSQDYAESLLYENQPDLVQSCLQRTSAEQISQQKQDNEITTENTVESLESFNSFLYWRDPIPDFNEQDICNNRNTRRRTIFTFNQKTRRKPVRIERPPDREMRACFKSSNDHSAKAESQLSNDFSNKLDTELDYYTDCLEGSNFLDCHSKNLAAKLRSLKRRRDEVFIVYISSSKQNCVPPVLLDAFISMSEIDSTDVRISCASTFPAVLLTLGASNWSLLKILYEKLAVDSDKKLRQMIASSIYQIASILGPEVATQDLIPIYNSLINDIEETRITAINHLSSFVKLLKPHGRYMFLPHLMEFMMTDYTWNWRFRKQLSEQLVEMMDYSAPTECWKFISPLAFTLLTDRVSAVRLQALNLVTHLIRVVSTDITLLRGILAELAEQFAHSTQWARRQSFAFLCSSLIKTPVLPDDIFARDVLPHLLDLSWDNIPNVRIAVARTLSCDIITYPFFSNVFSPHYDVLTQVLKRLCKDKDRDVRYFASLNISALPPLPSLEKPDEF